jgi:hypothetical protein
MQLNMLVFFLNHLFNNLPHQKKKERKTWKKTFNFFVFFKKITLDREWIQGKGRKKREKMSSIKISFICLKVFFFLKVNFKKMNDFLMFVSVKKNKLENTF